MSNVKTSQVPVEVVIDPTAEQIEKMMPFIEQWRMTKGLVVGAFADRDGTYKFGFRQVPPELGNKILKIVNDFYFSNGGQSDVSS